MENETLINNPENKPNKKKGIVRKIMKSLFWCFAGFIGFLGTYFMLYLLLSYFSVDKVPVKQATITIYLMRSGSHTDIILPKCNDLVDWNNRLNENEKHFIKNILAFFAASDGIVNENLVVNFYNEVQIPEARQFYSVQMMIEAIHGETYSLLIDTYVLNTEEKSRLFNAVETIPAVKRKAEWAIRWIQEGATLQQMIPQEYMQSYNRLLNLNEYGQVPFNRYPLDGEDVEALSFLTRERPSFAQRLLAFVCVEGIFFSGSFCAIYWLKSRGLMPGLSTANSFISRDENLHAEFAISLYKMLENRLDEDVVHSIFREAVEIEKEFITESLPVSLLGMNNKLMKYKIMHL